MAKTHKQPNQFCSKLISAEILQSTITSYYNTFNPEKQDLRKMSIQGVDFMSILYIRARPPPTGTQRTAMNRYGSDEPINLKPKESIL